MAANREASVVRANDPRQEAAAKKRQPRNDRNPLLKEREGCESDQLQVRHDHVGSQRTAESPDGIRDDAPVSKGGGVVEAIPLDLPKGPVRLSAKRRSASVSGEKRPNPRSVIARTRSPETKPHRRTSMRLETFTTAPSFVLWSTRGFF